MITQNNKTGRERLGPKIPETILLTMLGMVLTACSALVQVAPEVSQPGVPSPEVVVVSHPEINNVKVTQSESDPGEAVLSITGSLPNDCNKLDEWSLTREGKDFFVSLLVKSQQEADCTQLPVPFAVTIPLDVSGLESGSNTIMVNGILFPFDLSFENLLTTGSERPCQMAGSDEVSYTNEAHGYCLLYPAGFTVRNPEPNPIVIHGPNYAEGSEPLSGFLNIQVVEPARGRSAAQVSDELLTKFQGMEDITIERVDSLLGGEPAVEIIGMPGQALSWQVVTIHDDQVYLLVFSPLGEEYGQVFTDMQSLYDTVMRSFTFVDDPNG